MIAAPLIIDGSRTRRVWARGLDWVMSVLFWLLYAYLVRAALADLYRLADETMGWIFDGSGLPSVPEVFRFFATLWDYFVVAMAIGVILIAWARYNQSRFCGHRSCVTRGSKKVADLAARYRLSDADVANWQGSQSLTMQHAAGGTLMKVILG